MKIDELRKLVLEACAKESPCDIGVGPQAADGKEKSPGKMARTNLMAISRDVQELLNMFGDETKLDDWIEAKITKANDYLAAVKKHIGGEIVRSAGNLMESMPSAAIEEYILANFSNQMGKDQFQAALEGLEVEFDIDYPESIREVEKHANVHYPKLATVIQKLYAADLEDDYTQSIV